jgi:hypothetical protein
MRTHADVDAYHKQQRQQQPEDVFVPSTILAAESRYLAS